MGSGKTLTPEERAQIDVLKQRALSNRQIAKEIGRSHAVVNNYLNNKENYGKNRKGGIQTATTARERRAIVRLGSNSALSARQIANEVGTSASVRTVQRILKKCSHLRRRKLQKKPHLQAHHIAARLEFARAHMSWTSEWHAIIFSDEKRFCLDGPDGYAYYYHDLRKEEKYLSRRHSSVGAVMVWGAISYYGTISLVIITGNLNSRKYIDLLECEIPRIQQVMGQRRWKFQQDNSSVHAARIVKQWFDDHAVEVLKWPALSPDLNIIENVWGWLSREVYRGGKQFNTREELIQALKSTWQNMPVNYIQHLYRSLPSRIFELITAGGKYTHY